MELLVGKFEYEGRRGGSCENRVELCDSIVLNVDNIKN